MDWSLLAWLVAAAGVIAGVGAFVRMRAESGRASALALEAEHLQAELTAAREQLEKKTAAHRRAAEHESELRRKLDKTKKRAAHARSGANEGQAEAEEIKRLQSQLRLSQADQERLREELGRLASAPSTAKKLEGKEAELAAANERIHALERRVEETQAGAAASGGELAELKAESERLHKKLTTQDKLYVSVRSELEVKKDRIRAQTEELERLRAFKVAVVDPEPVAVDAAEAGRPEADEGTPH